MAVPTNFVLENRENITFKVTVIGQHTLEILVAF